MVTVALVGPDGAGKTTIARSLQDAFGSEAKYIYMGNNPDSSNLSLPTTRLAHRAKVRTVQRQRQTTRTEAGEALHRIEHRSLARGLPWRVARLVNRIVEASLRQLLAEVHLNRGRLVVFDRHPRFEFGLPDQKKKQTTENVHRWFIWSVLPEPDLVLLLDAPATTLFERKQEVPVDYIEKARRSYRAIGRTCANVVEIDVSEPIDLVLEKVLTSVEAVHTSTTAKEFSR